jgi:DNA primase
VAGRIRDEDIALVREKTPIADVIGEHVQLRNAGGGNLKGICPFHDEKSPSLSVSPARGLFHCFGCGVGGDVIRFVQNIDHLDFADAVQRLADRAGVQLRYVEGSTVPHRPQGQRVRLLDAHRLAAEFYAEQLSGAEAQPARDFLTQRGFDEAAANRFGCGFAPGAWDALTKHLLAKGFTGPELTVGGLSRESGRGSLIDRFHRRLLWPIREVGGDVVGFGARRLFDDDRVEAKYLNTPETPIYKKSQLLYGVDMAKREIARQHRAVIVEGYTDVMACHLAGVTTAVATCGTAFGTEHVSVIRRLLMDSDAFTGEVIFTFDGDAAGMKAAERAFADDQKFMSQTFVAIEPNGLDPCDLRLASGEAALLDLVAGRIPLVEFVLRSTVARFNLDTAEGQVAAMDAGIPHVARIKDRSLRDEYARRLAGLIGFGLEDQVVARVRGLARADDRGASAALMRNGSASAGAPAGGSANAQSNAQSGGPAAERPAQKVDESVASVEREVLKVALQLPAIAGPAFDALSEEAFLVSAHRCVRVAIAASGGTAAAVSGPGWTETVVGKIDESLRPGVHALAVEPLHTGPLSQDRYADAMLARLQEIVAARQISALKSRLQRINPQERPDEHARLFGELISLEKHRRTLRERAIG